MTEFKYEPMPQDLKVYREEVWVGMQLQTHLLKEMNGSVKSHETRMVKIAKEITKVKIVGATLAGLGTLAAGVLGLGKTFIKAFH